MVIGHVLCMPHVQHKIQCVQDILGHRVDRQVCDVIHMLSICVDGAKVVHRCRPDAVLCDQVYSQAIVNSISDGSNASGTDMGGEERL